MLRFLQVQRWAVACSLLINGPRVLEETLFVDSPLDSESSSQFVFYLLLIVVREFVAFKQRTVFNLGLTFTERLSFRDETLPTCD